MYLYGGKKKEYKKRYLNAVEGDFWDKQHFHWALPPSVQKILFLPISP